MTHHSNIAGNPSNQPITFDVADTCLTSIQDNELEPWLIVHRTPEGKWKEVNDEHDDSYPAFGVAPSWKFEQKQVLGDNGFASLNVGQNLDLRADLHYSGHGVELIVGERYGLCFRGAFLRWWKYATIEVGPVLVSPLTDAAPLNSNQVAARFIPEDEIADNNIRKFLERRNPHGLIWELWIPP